MEKITPEKRDAVALVREQARKNPRAIFDILDRYGTTEESKRLYREMTEVTCVLAELVGKRTRTHPREAIRNEIRRKGEVHDGIELGPMGEQALSLIEEILTSPKGTVIEIPSSGDEDYDRNLETGVWLGILEIGVDLAQKYADEVKQPLDSILEQLQLQLAADD